MAGEDFGCGITEADIEDAIEFSGYPLQTQVANLLREAKFFVQEEWSYIDDETCALRAMDILARKRLFEPSKEAYRVRPTLNLIIECKKSEYPFVFFLSNGSVHTTDFPYIAGLRNEKITISTDDSPSTWTYDPVSALGAQKHQFLASPPYHCMTFSKCARAGKKVVLSGDEPYNSIILPLVKSLKHLKRIEMPKETHVYFDCHIGVAVGVLDAPMVGVTLEEGKSKVTALQWVRVYRHQTEKDASKFEGQQILGIDLVQKQYFEEYLNKHLLPFGAEFSEKAIKHHKVLSSGHGFVTAMDKSWHRNIEPYLRDSTITSKAKRVVAAATGLVKKEVD